MFDDELTFCFNRVGSGAIPVCKGGYCAEKVGCWARCGRDGCVSVWRGNEWIWECCTCDTQGEETATGALLTGLRKDGIH